MGEILNNEFVDLVTAAELTPTLQKIAEYVVDNLESCCFVTAMELANILGVSYASVIRLTRQLGFSGYIEFQTFIRDIYLSEHSSTISDTVIVPTERIDYAKARNSIKEIQDTALQYSINNIHNTFKSNSSETYEQAAKLIINSNKRYIIASRGSSCISTFLSTMLKQTTSNVFNYTGREQTEYDFVSDLTSADCLIAIAFPRYSQVTILATKMAKEQGAKIIAITDKITSDLAKISDITILARCDSCDFFNSYVAALFAAEILCSEICRETNYSNIELLSRINRYATQTGNF